MQSRRGAHLGAEQRGLSTARAALRVLWMLARNPAGVRADEVADALAKSVSTAYNLLASLCEEGVAMRGPGAVYRLAPPFTSAIAGDAPASQPDAALASRVGELFARTHKRSYLGVVEDGRLHVVVERGLQGMMRVEGLGSELDDAAHGLALGKVLLAFAGEDTVERYVRRGLRAFTPNTITRPQALLAELREVRRAGLAVDREEFCQGCCCLAAPVLDARGGFLGSLGISMSRRAFDAEHEALAETLRDVARGARWASRFQPCADPHEFLDLTAAPAITSPEAGAAR